MSEEDNYIDFLEDVEGYNIRIPGRRILVDLSATNSQKHRADIPASFIQSGVVVAKGTDLQDGLEFVSVDDRVFFHEDSGVAISFNGRPHAIYDIDEDILLIINMSNQDTMMYEEAVVLAKKRLQREEKQKKGTK